jgi:hypothetical protein
MDAINILPGSSRPGKSFYSAMIGEALMTMGIMESMGEQRIQEAIDLYWEACKYPRKKKKAMRKKAQADYSFYKSLDNFQKQEFGSFRDYKSFFE